MTLGPLAEHHLESLSLKGGCTGSSVSTLVKMPHCWKSHVAAHVSPPPPPRPHTVTSAAVCSKAMNLLFPVVRCLLLFPLGVEFFVSITCFVVFLNVQVKQSSC